MHHQGADSAPGYKNVTGMPGQDDSGYRVMPGALVWTNC